MKVPLDTQVWLWMQVSPERFSFNALTLLSEPENQLLLSAASSWEIAIKSAPGRLPLPQSPQEYVPRRMRSSGVGALPIQHLHALKVASLPSHHRDPFDRLINAQAQTRAHPGPDGGQAVQSVRCRVAVGQLNGRCERGASDALSTSSNPVLLTVTYPGYYEGLSHSARTEEGLFAGIGDLR